MKMRIITCFGEGREGVKWELGFAFFRGWEMGLGPPFTNLFGDRTISRG